MKRKSATVRLGALTPCNMGTIKYKLQRAADLSQQQTACSADRPVGHPEDKLGARSLAWLKLHMVQSCTLERGGRSVAMHHEPDTYNNILLHDCLVLTWVQY